MSYFHAINGQGGSPTPSQDHPPVLLWENPNPSATFDAQTVELDLSQYVGAIIEFNEGSVGQSVVCSRVYIEKNDTQGLYGGSVVGGETHARKATVTNTGVIFEIGSYGVNSSTSPNIVIPSKIYGVQEYVVEQRSDAPELLWTNSAPTSAFATQTVSIDLSEYEGVLVEFRGAFNVEKYGTAYAKKGTTGFSGGAYPGGSADSFGRDFTVSASGVTFTDGYNGTTKSNTNAIPYKIYGVKGAVVEPTVGTTLWTNSNPNAEFVDQTISLDLSNYDGVEIECMGSTVATSYKQKTILYKNENVRQGLMMYHVYDNIQYYTMRGVEVKNTGVHFYTAAYHPFVSGGGWVAGDINMIPLSIKGIKFN